MGRQEPATEDLCLELPLNRNNYNSVIGSSVCLNGLFPSSKNPHFQNEAKHNIFFGIMSFNCMRIGQLHDDVILPQLPESLSLLSCANHVQIKGRIIRKVMGGGGEFSSRRNFF